MENQDTRAAHAGQQKSEQSRDEPCGSPPRCLRGLRDPEGVDESDGHGFQKAHRFILITLGCIELHNPKPGIAGVGEASNQRTTLAAPNPKAYT